MIAGNLLKGRHGFLAECQLQITERVEGYEERGDTKVYSDLRQSNPNMSPKTRDFRTTGVVLKVEKQWMREGGVKSLLADALRDLMVREYSISSQDIGAVATNIAVVTDGQRHSVSDAIVVYDATYGSLRLTEPVFCELDALIGRLEKSSERSSDEEALVPKQTALALREWFEELETGRASDFSDVAGGGVESTTDGLLYVLAPGSLVAKRDSQGVLRDIEIVAPEIVDLGGPPKLFYRYRVDGPGAALIPADVVQQVGDEYQLRRWNPRTSEYVDDGDDEY